MTDLLAVFPESVGQHRKGDHIPMSFMNKWIDERLNRAGTDAASVTRTGTGYNARAGGAIATELAEPQNELIRQLGGWASVDCHRNYTGA